MCLVTARVTPFGITGTAEPNQVTTMKSAQNNIYFYEHWEQDIDLLAEIGHTA